MSPSSVRPTYRPLGANEQVAGTLVLRDGSTLSLLRSLPEDTERIGGFLDRLSEEDRTAVRGGLGGDPDRTTEMFLVARGETGDQVLGLGAYRVLDGGRVARMTLAVLPEVRNLGVASLLVERLAVLAAQMGVDELRGTVPAGDERLAGLLERAGFHQEGPEWVRATRDPEHEGEGVGRRVYTAASLHTLFHPRSVAVIGASRDPSAVGHRILTSLVRSGFEGPVYPVNPSADHVGSIQAWPSIGAIGRPVDLAVIAVPASRVLGVVEACAEAGVRGLVMITAGFAETGEEGAGRQRELLELVRRRGMRMIGPNCLGLVQTDPAVRLNASFAPEMPPRGRVALSSQSGALGVAIIALAKELGLGLSTFVSVGNKADVSGNDLLEYWEEDADTDVILFYLEAFGNPRRFARIARRVGRRKPIVAVKAGRTEAGSKAASSHTAALTAADTAVQALFDQTGILRADTLEEMFGIARALVDQPLPRGPRVAIVTNAGGPAILCADALEAAGLEVKALSDETQAALRQFLPAEASPHNPVDMIASAGPDHYRRAVEAVLSDPAVDALVVIYTPVGMFETDAVGRGVAEGLLAAREKTGIDKPVLGNLVGEKAALMRIAYQGVTVPVYPFPETIGRVLAKITRYATWRRRDPGVFSEFEDQDLDAAQAVCRRALEDRGEGWLSAEEAVEVCEAAGLRMAGGGVARSAEDAARIAGKIGFPVAVKLVSLEISHKTDIGGVVLGLQSPDEVQEAFRDIRRRLVARGQGDAMQGVLVQPMLTGTEVMIGVQVDPSFGPLVAFGLGGVHVEILRDVAFRVVPLTDHDAAAMVRGIRGFRLLQGYRGHPAADLPALEEALRRVSHLVERVPEIGELDMNPLFALAPGEGYRVVDIRIRVRGA